jgi:hypothetical protein
VDAADVYRTNNATVCARAYCACVVCRACMCFGVESSDCEHAHQESTPEGWSGKWVRGWDFLEPLRSVVHEMLQRCSVRDGRGLGAGPRTDAGKSANSTVSPSTHGWMVGPHFFVQHTIPTAVGSACMMERRQRGPAEHRGAAKRTVHRGVACQSTRRTLRLTPCRGRHVDTSEESQHQHSGAHPHPVDFRREDLVCVGPGRAWATNSALATSSAWPNNSAWPTNSAWPNNSAWGC